MCFILNFVNSVLNVGEIVHVLDLLILLTYKLQMKMNLLVKVVGCML